MKKLLFANWEYSWMFD